MRLAANTGETFAVLRSVPIYDAGTNTYSLYDFDAAGYAPGDDLDVDAQGALYWTLRSEIDDSIPTIEVLGVDTLAYQVPFVLNSTIDTQGDFYFVSTESMRGITFNYEVRYVNTSTGVTSIEKGQFYFN